MESYTGADEIPQNDIENASFKGREAIPADVALRAQKLLIRHMIPDELSKYLAGNLEDLEDLDSPVLNAVIMRWLEKYALDFNGFAEYCDLHAGDGFIDRVINDDMTETDLTSIKNFLETHPRGGSFFTPEELQEFIEKIPDSK